MTEPGHPDFPVNTDGTPGRSPEDLQTAEHTTVSDKGVLARLDYLALENDTFKSMRGRNEGINPMKLDAHRGEIGDLRRDMQEAGLSERDERLITGYFGFQPAGRIRLAELASELGESEDQLVARLGNLSARLRQTNWGRTYPLPL